ncbi:MAG: VacJ family lipoprotein [Rhodocyclaceae bacterium]|nr:VacJ family lipoprotein [Rhodocyclaceae bacterium]
MIVARMHVRIVLALVIAGLLGGCASSGNPRDPVEGFNRAMFAFNDGLDKAVIKPVARGYEATLPVTARNGVANFFGNIADVFIGVNNALQGKMPEAINDFGRVMVNTTLGVFGFMDVASDLGVDKHDEDFGQTFGRWGSPTGAYLVLPVFGPRNVRDTAGLAFDLAADPVGNVESVASRNVLVATRLISDRAALLPADKVIEEAALDKYSYIRDAYLQRRRNLVYDGAAPRLPDNDE